jgi:hypothetical protein
VGSRQRKSKRRISADEIDSVDTGALRRFARDTQITATDGIDRVPVV